MNTKDSKYNYNYERGGMYNFLLHLENNLEGVHCPQGDISILLEELVVGGNHIYDILLGQYDITTMESLSFPACIINFVFTDTNTLEVYYSNNYRNFQVKKVNFETLINSIREYKNVFIVLTLKNAKMEVQENLTRTVKYLKECVKDEPLIHIKEETHLFIQEVILKNLIDHALDNRDEEAFFEYTNELNNLQKRIELSKGA